MQKLIRLPEREAANTTWKENNLLGPQICNFIFFREENEQSLFAVTKNSLSASTTAVKRPSLDFIYLSLGHSTAEK